MQKLVDDYAADAPRRRQNFSWVSPSERTKIHEKNRRMENIGKKVQELNKPLRAKRSTTPKAELSSKGSSGKERFHLTPSGQSRKCSATVRGCPYGGADKHYSSKEAARKAYEKSQGGSF